MFRSVPWSRPQSPGINPEPTPKVFLSYAAEDSQLALRLYDDLARSGIRVWRYEKDSKRGRDYEKEYLQELYAANFFCLLDSPYARKSVHVIKEIEEGLKKFSSENRFIVCLATKADDWRMLNDNSPLNKITYISFARDAEEDVFDQHDSYKKSITELVKMFGSEHLPWAPQAWVDDLANEFFHVKQPLSMEMKEVLLSEFHSANHYWQNGDLEKAEARLNLLMKDYAHLSLISPGLLLGAVYFDQHKTLEAKELYSKITSKFPNDPRGWFGLGLAEYYCSAFEAAIAAYEKALKATEKHPGNNHHERAKPKVIYSQTMALIQLQRFQEAERSMSGLPETYQHLPETKVAKTLLLLQSGKTVEARSLYKSLTYLYDNIEDIPMHVSVILADLELRLSRRCIEIVDRITAIEHFKKATRLQPFNIQYWAELALLYHCERAPTQKKEAINSALQLQPETIQEEYFYGLVHFLNNDENRANTYYEASKSLNWPPYARLIL